MNETSYSYTDILVLYPKDKMILEQSYTRTIIGRLPILASVETRKSTSLEKKRSSLCGGQHRRRLYGLCSSCI